MGLEELAKKFSEVYTFLIVKEFVNPEYKSLLHNSPKK